MLLDTTFMGEFNQFLEGFTTKSVALHVCGDFNYWVDKPYLKQFFVEFLNLINRNHLFNHIDQPTYVGGHALDLLLSPVGCNRVSQVEVVVMDPGVSDLTLITVSVNIPRPSFRKEFRFRNYRNIDQKLICHGTDQSLNAIDISVQPLELV